MDSIREQWNLPVGATVAWDSWTVRTTAAAAFTAIRPEKNVYLCNINTPGEVVIAGERDGCRRALERIGASVASPVPIPVTMHCDATRGEYQNIVDIHSLTTASVPGLEFFTSATCRPIDFAMESPAHTTAEAYCRVVDFPRLIRNVYASGPKVFIEAGGRRNCCTWIEKILRDRPHAAVPCDLKGQTSATSILRMMARLIAHRVRLDTTPLFLP
jgi:PfaB family protein